MLLRALQRTFDVIVVAAVPVVAGTLAVAPQIVHFLAPASFDAAAEPLRIVIVGTGFSFLSTFYAYAVVAFDRQRDAIWLYAATLVFNLVLNLALIPSYGYLAAAWVATVSEILIFIGLAVLTRRFVGFLPRPTVALRAIVAGAVMFGVVYPLDIRLPFAIVIGAVVYGTCIALLRVPRKIELRELLAGEPRPRERHRHRRRRLHRLPPRGPPARGRSLRARPRLARTRRCIPSGWSLRDYLAPGAELQAGRRARPRRRGEGALDGVDSVVHLAAAVGVGQSMYEIERYTSGERDRLRGRAQGGREDPRPDRQAGGGLVDVDLRRRSVRQPPHR